MFPIKDYLAETRMVNARIILFACAVVVLALILLTRLFYLQVLQHTKFVTLAQKNRISFQAVPSVRGLIYDRNGVLLAQNMRVVNLEIQPEKVKHIDQVITRLGDIIEITKEDVAHFNRLRKRRPAFEPQAIKRNLSESEIAIFSANQPRFEGVHLRARLQRYYPESHLASHVIGYVGRVSAENLKTLDQKTYRGVEYVGKNGVESYYESSLLGKSGVTKIETNAHGRIINSVMEQKPTTGNTLHLSLDIRLQEQSILALDGYEGAVVAIEPATGEVLAFASVPGYDPNQFVNGISEVAYAKLKNSVNKPLLNRALYGRYAPGSTIKGFMSLVGMSQGIDHRESVYGPGWFRLPNKRHKYRCWKADGHGTVDGHKAIVESCDVYYYNLANTLGIDQMHRGLSKFGFGQRTGIDLMGEPSGLMPSREWKKRTKNKPWYLGETVIAGIGQGYVLTTPIQLAVATATLANRGKRVSPRLLTSLENPQSEVKKTVAVETQPKANFSNQDFDKVIHAMRDVVHSAKGTARGIGVGLRYEMAGKTGTAQVKSIAQGQTYDEENTDKKFRDHSLFIGFAPLDNPKIAIAVVVEHAGSGSKTAAPIARRLLDFYLLEGLQQKQDQATKS